MSRLSRQRNAGRTDAAVAASLVAAYSLVNVTIYKGIIPIPHVCNYGIAFSIQLHSWVFVIMWVSIVGLLLWQYVAHAQLASSDASPEASQRKYFRLAIVLILSGAVANILDRVLYGCVIDYISLLPQNAFNLADASIFIGAMVFLLVNMKRKD